MITLEQAQSALANLPLPQGVSVEVLPMRNPETLPGRYLSGPWYVHAKAPADGFVEQCQDNLADVLRAADVCLKYIHA